VVFIYAGSGLTIFLARRAPTAGPCAAASNKPRFIRTKKVFTFGNVLNFTKQAKLLGEMQNFHFPCDA